MASVPASFSKLRLRQSSPSDLGPGPCLEPFSCLRRITLNDLILGEVKLDSYLLVRIHVPPSCLSAVFFVGEDSEGEMERFAVYGHPYFENQTPSSLSRVLPAGILVAIRHPFFKLAVDGDYAIRIDSPSNVFFLPPAISMKDAIRDLAEANLAEARARVYQEEGNKHYKAKKLGLALDCFTMAAGSGACPWQVFANRSPLQLKFGRPYEALCDARNALERGPGTPASFSRALDAALACSMYVAAEEYRKSFLKASGKEEEADSQLSEIRRCVRQQQIGDYSTFGLMRAALMGQSSAMGDYIGPIRVITLGGRGRRVVAARKVKPGELLVCCRALYSAEIEELPSELAINLSSPTATCKPALGQIQLKAQGAASFDRLARYKLSILSDKPPRVSMDELRCLGNLEEVSGAECPTPVQIQALCEQAFETQEATAKRLALFLVPSLFRHSCVPNTLMLAYGDVMMLRSNRPVEEGEELTVARVDPRERLPFRTRFCEAKGFRCDCKLCEAQQHTLTPRQSKLLADADELTITGSRVASLPLPRVKQRRLEQTFSGLLAESKSCEAVRHVLMRTADFLGIAQLQQGQPQLCVETVARALEGYGVSLDKFDAGGCVRDWDSLASHVCPIDAFILETAVLNFRPPAVDLIAQGNRWVAAVNHLVRDLTGASLEEVRELFELRRLH